MKLIYLLPLTLAACSSLGTGIDPNKMAYSDANLSEWRTDQPEIGDCVDYTLGMSRKLGGGGYLVGTSAQGGQDHAVLYHSGKVYDQLGQKIRPAQIIGSVACDLTTGNVGFINPQTQFVPFTTLNKSEFGAHCQKAARELNASK
jgi:hypothetical protein